MAKKEEKHEEVKPERFPNEPTGEKRPLAAEQKAVIEKRAKAAQELKESLEHKKKS